MMPAMPPQRVLRMLFWETTVRCNLACAHCRRLESNEADSADLSSAQAEDLIEQLAELGRRQQQRGGGVPPLRVAGIPRLRGGRLVPASRGRDALDTREQGQDALATKTSGPPMPVLVFSGGEPLCRRDLFPLIGAARQRGIIPALAETDMLSPQGYEQIMCQIVELEGRGQIQIKVTCGPHYERVRRQFRTTPGGSVKAEGLGDGSAAFGEGHRQASLDAATRARHQSTRGCLAGLGVLFVSYRGDVYP